MAGVPLLTAESLKRNEAVSAELTREKWKDLGYPDVEPIPAHLAGKHLLRIAQKHDFTLFEYWLTDHAGHSQRMDFSVMTLERLDEFIGGIIEELDRNHMTLVLISDHGNIEDLSTKSHTRNQVPCIIVGRMHRRLASQIRSLTDITPAVLTLLKGQ